VGGERRGGHPLFPSVPVRPFRFFSHKTMRGVHIYSAVDFKENRTTNKEMGKQTKTRSPFSPALPLLPSDFLRFLSLSSHTQRHSHQTHAPSYRTREKRRGKTHKGSRGSLLSPTFSLFQKVFFPHCVTRITLCVRMGDTKERQRRRYDRRDRHRPRESRERREEKKRKKRRKNRNNGRQ